MLDGMAKLAVHLGSEYEAALEHYQAEFENPQNLHWKKILREMEELDQDFIEYHLGKAREHYAHLKNV